MSMKSKRFPSYILPANGCTCTLLSAFVLVLSVDELSGILTSHQRMSMKCLETELSKGLDSLVEISPRKNIHLVKSTFS